MFDVSFGGDAGRRPRTTQLSSGDRRRRLREPTRFPGERRREDVETDLDALHVPAAGRRTRRVPECETHFPTCDGDGRPTARGFCHVGPPRRTPMSRNRVFASSVRVEEFGVEFQVGGLLQVDSMA